MPAPNTSLGDNLWRHANGRLYGRFEINGKRTWKRLASIVVRDARAEIMLLQTNHDRAQRGLCEDPFSDGITFDALAAQFGAAGYPSSRRTAGSAQVRSHVSRLSEFFRGKRLHQIDVVSRNEYHAWRLKRITRGAGHRAVELELSTLNTMLRWGASHIRGARVDLSTLVAPRFRSSVRHCTEVMLRSDEELHMLANHLLGDPRTETCAWQVLFEALTGCRSGEILELRMDAVVDQPGHVGDRALAIRREKGGTFPWVLLDVLPGHSPLRDLIAAHRRWHADRFPTSPWYFPGRTPADHSDPGRLAHALPVAAKTLGLPHRTCHGLRAYYVATLRSLGIDDSEVSKRLGHRSGVGLVERTYGEPRPGWFGSKAQDFVPAAGGDNPVPIAWSGWLDAAPNIIPIAGGALA